MSFDCLHRTRSSGANKEMLHTWMPNKWLHYIKQKFNSWFLLLVCLGFFVPLENFSLVWRRHHYRWMAANFDLYSVFMTSEQWGFFSVPHLLWHESPLIMVVSEDPRNLAVELSLPVYYVCRGWISNTQPSACEANAVTYCVTATLNQFYLHILCIYMWIYFSWWMNHGILRISLTSFRLGNWPLIASINWNSNNNSLF